MMSTENNTSLTVGRKREDEEEVNNIQTHVNQGSDGLRGRWAGREGGLT